MITIGIDAGTSIVKSAACSDDGTELAVAQRPTQLTHPHPGWAEQDMDEVFTAVTATVREVVEATGQDVRALALTAQGDGCWLVDPAGRPTGPALLWNDARAAPIATRWAGDGLLDELFGVNGSVGFAGLPHAQLAWLAEHEPERIAASNAVLSCGGWLYRCLTGRLAWDVSEASNPFLDARTGEYSRTVLDRLGLRWAERLLPEVLDGQERLAPLSENASEQLGLRPGTPVVLAAYDVVSTALGAGATEVGQACSILGTTLCTEVISDSPRWEREPVGMTLRTPMPDRWMLAYATLAGTEVVEWTSRSLGASGPSELTELTRDSEPGSRGLLLLPYLSPAGERAPFHDAAARGSVHGLALDHRPADIARASLEGLAMVIRDRLRASTASPTELRITGGGSANDLWRQIIADVTGLPVVRGPDGQAGARGAVLTARAVLEQRTISEVATDLVATPAVLHPQERNRARYDEAFERFIAARDTTRNAGWFRPQV